jgi:hypothetical protein
MDNKSGYPLIFIEMKKIKECEPNCEKIQNIIIDN